MQTLPWYKDIFKSEEVAAQWVPILEEARNKYYGHGVQQTISSLPLLNFDKLYEENRKTGAELVAVGHDDECDSIEEIKKTLFQSSDGNLTFIAQCKCGFMRGNYHLDDICPRCHTKVETSFADEINIRAWLEIPESLPPFLHPVVHRVLSKWMGVAKRRMPILEAIMNVEADLPFPLNQEHGLGQGMWYFHDHFGDIIRFIASTHKGPKAQQDEALFKFLEANKDCIFVRHLPILNQSLHILTHSGSMTYNDESSKHILRTCIELDEVIKQQRHNPKQNRNYLDQQVFNTYKAWTDYIDSVINDKLIHKSGFIRKNILGTRLHWTGRGVIVPITSRHWADEIELPWRMVVGLFKLEIINKLKLNYGFDVNTAMRYWQQAQTGIKDNMQEGREKEQVLESISYVKTCIDQLLAECPFKGFPIIMGRNPTLRQGALQLFFMRHYKTDQTDDTIGMSPFAITCPNADYDGDSLYLASLKECASVIDFLSIHPMTTLLGASGKALSNNVHMSDEMAIACQGFFTDNGNLDIESYYKQIEKLKKQKSKAA